MGVKRALDAHSLWRAHNEFEVKLDERLNEWHAVEAAITVDAVDLDEFSSSADEPANRLPQRAGVIRLDRFGCERKSNGGIDDTECHKCVREVCSAVWIDRTDVRCVVRSVVEPFVDIERNIDRTSERPLAAGVSERGCPDAIELSIDGVRAQSTKVVEQ